MSRAGSRRSHDEGYSLVELLATLALLALIAVLASTPVFKGQTAAEERGAISHLANVLRQARERAITATHDVRFVLDLDRRTFSVEGTQLAGTLPAESAVSFRTALNHVISERRGAISFSPDGSSSGATITLGLRGRTWQVTVNWLTGRVTSREEVQDE